MGPECGELMSIVSIIMKQQLKSDQVVGQFFPYLTMSEAVKLAALSFDSSIEKLSCCAS